MDQHLYTVEEVAEKLKLNVRTVRLYLREGKRKGARIGKQYRITQGDLDAFAGAAPAVPPRDAVNVHRTVEVSAIVTITAIDRERVMRLSNMLVAAANGNRGGTEGPLRVETIYDESRAALKV